MPYMQTGKYIENRILPDVIRAICLRKDILLEAFSEDWVIRLTKDNSSAWIYGYHFDLNSGAANEIANDKVATYLVLDAAGVPAIAHYLLRSEAREPIVASKIIQRIPDVDNPFVIKPLSGSSGKYLHYASNLVAGLEITRSSGESAWAASPHEDIVKEFRVVTLDKEPELIYEKTNPVVVNDLKLFNLGLGARAVNISQENSTRERLSELASAASHALHLRVAAVDIVQLADGQLKVLEINSGISFEHYGRQSQQNHKKAEQIYDKIIDRIFTND